MHEGTMNAPRFRYLLVLFFGLLVVSLGLGPAAAKTPAKADAKSPQAPAAADKAARAKTPSGPVDINTYLNRFIM